jgi:hypothetical protein
MNYNDFKLKNKNVLRPDYFNNLRAELGERYIIEPFFRTIGDRKIKVITAPTGFGKTFTIWNIISPTFLREHGQLHIHVGPHTETLDETEIEGYLYKSFKNQDYPLIIYNKDKFDYTHIRNSLVRGRKVIIVTTDQSMMHQMNEENSRFTQLVKDYASVTLVTRDEMSWGTTTSAENYKDNQGYNGHKYRGTYIKNLYTLFSLGCDFYGFTATPNREQLGELPIAFEENMEIINTWPSQVEMILFQKWWQSMKPTDYTTDAYWDKSILVKEIRHLIDEVKQRERHLNDILEGTPYSDSNPKFTSMLAVQTDTGREDRFTINSVLDVIKSNPNIIPIDYTFIVTTADGWIEYNHQGDTTGNSGNGSEWLSLMNSQTSSSRLLVVIYKGIYGVNIPSLCAGVALRNPSGKTSDTGETVRTSGQQFLGRFNRTNLNEHSWKLFKDLSKEYGDEVGLDYLITKNTFTFRAPDDVNNYWRDTIEDFQENYGNSYGQMINHLYLY